MAKPPTDKPEREEPIVTEEMVKMGSQWGGTLPQIEEDIALRSSGSSAMAGIRKEARDAARAERESGNFLLEKAGSILDPFWMDDFQKGPFPVKDSVWSPFGVDIDVPAMPGAQAAYQEYVGDKVNAVTTAITDFFESASGVMAMGYSRIDDKRIEIPDVTGSGPLTLASGNDILPDLTLDEAKELGIGVAFELGANTRVGSYSREYKRLSENYENWAAAEAAGNMMARLGLGEWAEPYRETFLAPQVNEGVVGGDYLVPEGFDPRNPEDLKALYEGPQGSAFSRRSISGEIIGTWYVGAAPFKVPKLLREGSRTLGLPGVTQRNLGMEKIRRALEKQTDDYIESLAQGTPRVNAAGADAEFMARSSFDELMQANFGKFRRGNNAFASVIASIGHMIDNPRDAAVFLAAAGGSVKYQRVLVQEHAYLADAILRAKKFDIYEKLGWARPPGFEVKPILAEPLEGTPSAALFDDVVTMAHRRGLLEDAIYAVDQMGLQGMTTAGTNWALGKNIANAWRAGKANRDVVQLNRIDAIRKAMGLKPVQEYPVAMPRLAREPEYRYVSQADGSRMQAMIPVSGIEEVTFQLSAHARPVSILKWINGQRGTAYVPISTARNDGSYGWDEISASLSDSRYVRKNPELLGRAEAIWAAARTETERMQAVANIERMVVAAMAKSRGVKVRKVNPSDPDEPMGAEELYAMLSKRRSNTTNALKMREGRAYGFDPETGQMIIAHPRLVSQLETHVPMLDMALMDKTIRRMGSKSYGMLFRSPDRAQTAMVKTSQASASMGTFFDEVNSLWKANVLLRGGYTIRNVGEAWMRSLAYLETIPGLRDGYAAEAAYNVLANRATAVGRAQVRAREKQINAALDDYDSQLQMLREEQDRLNGEIKKIVDEAESPRNEVPGLRVVPQQTPRQSEVIQDIIANTVENEGLTVRYPDGFVPNSGYVVARVDSGMVQYEMPFTQWTNPEVAQRAVEDFIYANRKYLDNDNLFLGTWYSKDSDSVFLDVVELVEDRATAVRLGNERNQKAIFDLDALDEIPTGGTGQTNGKIDWDYATRGRSNPQGRQAPVGDDARGNRGTGQNADDAASDGDAALLQLREQLAAVRRDINVNRSSAGQFARELDDLSNKRFKYRKRRAGDREGAAFAGLYGDMIRESAGNQRTVENFLQSRVGRAMDERSFDSWVEVKPGDKNYWSSYAGIYEQHMSSPVHIKFANGSLPEDVIKWMNGPKGLETRSRLGVRQGQDVVSYVYQEYRMFDYYFRTQTMKQWLTREQFPTPTEIRGQLGALQPERLPVLYGPRRSENIAKTETGLARVKKVQQKVFEWIGSMPESRLARHPFYAETFSLRRQELLDIARGQGLDLDDADVIVKIDRSAHAYSRKRTDDIMFTITRYSNPAALFKFISPFFAAGENALRTWGHIVTRDPSVLYRANVLWNLPNQHGLVYTYDMEPVPPSALSFATGGDEGHYVLMPMEWAQKYEQLANKILPGDVGTGGMVPAFPKASANVVMQGSIPLIPGGFGPSVLVPVNLVLYNRPDRQEILRNALGDKAYEMIVPFGRVEKPGIGQSLSSWERRGLQRIRAEDDRAYVGIRNNVAKNLLYEWMEGGQKGRRPTAEDVDQATNNWYTFHILASATSPVAVLPLSKYQTEISTYRKYLTQMPMEAAMDRFIEQFGPEAVALVSSTTIRNVGGVRADMPSYEAVKASEKYIMKYSDPKKGVSAASIIGTATERGEFDPGVYNWLRDSTDPATQMKYMKQPTVEELEQQTVLTLAWREYNQLKKQRDAFRASGMKKDTVDAWFRQKTKVEMPEKYDYTDRGKNLWLSTLQDFESKQATNLGVIANLLMDQSFRNSVEGDTNTWRLIEEYMDKRVQYMGMKDAGLDSGLVRDMWNSWKDDFKDSSLTFRNFYDVFLENDELTVVVDYKRSVTAGLKEAS